MKKNKPEETLSPLCQDVLDKLKAVDIAELIQFYSTPGPDKKTRDHKMRGFLLLHEALVLLRDAKSFIK